MAVLPLSTRCKLVDLLTRAGQAVLAGKALYGGQLALNAAHHLPYPVEGMLHPLQGPQQPEQAEVA